MFGCVFKSKEKKVWIILQMEVIFLGYWRKKLYIQWFWTLIKNNSSKCNDILIFLNGSCLVFGIFYVSHITFGDLFLLKIFVGWKKGHDGNENSLKMVRLLFFMNIICVQIPSAKLYQAFFSQIKKLTIYQICNELWFDMKSKKDTHK
jgi:hypothetical protein